LPLSAVVSFHGSLESFHTAEPGSITAKILVCHGEADSMVTLDDVDAFKQEMEIAGADSKVLILPGAKHSFTSREADADAQKLGIDIGYQQQADEQSWAAMQTLFSRVF